MDYVGKTYSLDLAGMKTAFLVKKIQNNKAVVMDIVGKDVELPLKFMQDWLQTGHMKQTDKLKIAAARSKWVYEKWSGGTNAWKLEVGDLSVAVYSGPGKYHIDIECDHSREIWSFSAQHDNLKNSIKIVNGAPQWLLDEAEKFANEIIKNNYKKPAKFA